MKSERTYPVYKVNKHAEGLLVGGHPWVYENDILEAPGTEPENGTLVDVVSPKGAYLGTGFLSLKSKIRVRLISRNANDTFDATFWRRRVEYAWAYRKTVLEPADLSACRFIFGEADQFPGLTVDRFNNVLVTQTLSVGMEKLKPVLFPLLAEVLRADGQTIDGIYERNDEALRAKEGLEQNKGWFALPGESHPNTTQTEICENGVYYHVDFENGQKTGFFLDQKYNRRAVARLAAGHTVLDCFTHTGSFALNAAKGGAARVTAADISAEAIAMAQRNAQRNNLTNMDFLCEDTFELLPRLEKEGRYTATRRCIQHGKVSVYAHCVSVADTACVLAETLHLRVNERALIRGALLHDYFLYDWHDKANGHHWHGFTHPGTALHNASEDWKLTPVEREIIKKHMFPLTPIPPTCREAWLVCLADKICAAKETTGGIYGKLPFAAKHNAQDK